MSDRVDSNEDVYALFCCSYSLGRYTKLPTAAGITAVTKVD